MKTHTSQFKEDIKTVGKQLDSKITFKVDGVTQTLTSEDLNSVTPTFQGAILKSVMKELDIDSNVNIPIGTEVNYQFGVKLENNFEYLDYGNYIVYSSEKQEDTSSYKIICYDKMLYSMKQNEDLEITYPINIRDYINALCTKIGLEFKNQDETFANYDKMINEELYVGLDYTYRDILDELAQVTASTICLNSEDKVEIRYINDLTELNEVVGTNININDSIDYKLNFLTLYGNSTQATRSGKNLFDVNDCINKPYSTLGEDGWITAVCDNTDGDIIKYMSYWTNNLPLKTSTQYALFVEVQSVSGTLYPEFASTPSTSQNITNIYRTSITTGIHKFLITTRDDFSSTTYGIRTVIGVPVGSNASITYRISVLEDTTITTDDFVYEPYGVMPSPDYPSPIESITEISVTATGKNLFDVDSITENAFLLAGTGGTGSTSASNTSDYIFVKTNQSYCLSFSYTSLQSTNYRSFCYYDTNKNFISSITIDPTSFHTFTPAQDGYIRFTYDKNYTNIQLEKGTQATTYEPYQSNTSSIDLQGNELCSLPNGTKDELVIENGKAIITKRIGKVVLDGSENWQNWSVQETTDLSHYLLDNAFVYNKTSGTDIRGICDNYVVKANGNPLEVSLGLRQTGDTLNRIYLTTLASLNTLELFKTYLSTHNVEVLYELEEPETINLGTVEMPHTYEGVSNITNSADTEMVVKYSKGWETINEEYLKDINVNFGQKYGPVNSVVLTRGAESDNIYLQDENSIAQNGLCEIKIADNQIMNWNDRSDYLPDILEKLNGLEYYLNDFSSTGIAYLDLCDRYNVEVFGNTYSCVMFNDELLVTQGLEENIHTDMPEETETDYTKADKTDKKIKQAYIIVDKQNQTINSVVQDIGALNDTINSQGEQIEALGTRITQTTDNITATVTSIQDTLDNGVNLVKTTTVIVDDSGLTVATDTSKTTTKMTSDKFAVTSGSVDLALFGYDETEGRSKAEMDNLTVKNYLTAGYHRQEKFEPDGEKRTGWFYVGGGN